MTANEHDLGIPGLTDVRPIGHGGFSRVYGAFDTQLHRPVAVKILDELKTDSDRRRFDRECEVLGRVSAHPNIVTVFSAGFSQRERPYLVMELVEGGSIHDRLRAGGPFAWRQALELIIPAGRALASAHDQGVLHRDIKPENILLAPDGPRLADFGIASLRDTAGTASTKITASWLHAPPETFANQRDERSDVYSLASTAYTMIVGTAPFWRDDEDSLAPLIQRLLHENSPPIPPHLAPPAVDHLLRTTLAKQPEARPQTATDFVANLEQLLVSPEMPPAFGTAVVAGPASSHVMPLANPVMPVAPGGAPPLQPSTVSGASGRGGPNWMWVGLGAAALLLVAGVGAVLATMGGDDGGSDGTSAQADGIEQSPPESIDDTTGADTESDGTSTPGITDTDTDTDTVTDEGQSDSGPVSVAAGLTGTWEGDYACSLGITGLRLHLVGQADGSITALFEGFAVPSNPDLPDLSYLMTGEVIGDTLELRAERWINRPTGYVMTDISARVTDSDAVTLEGEMSLDQCAFFSVTKVSSDEPTLPT